MNANSFHAVEMTCKLQQGLQHVCRKYVRTKPQSSPTTSQTICWSQGWRGLSSRNRYCGRLL